jgi:hypothetical protein
MDFAGRQRICEHGKEAAHWIRCSLVLRSSVGDLEKSGVHAAANALGLLVREGLDSKRKLEPGGPTGLKIPEDVVRTEMSELPATPITNMIRNRLKLTTLQYQTLPNRVDALDMLKDRVCACCWDGRSRGLAQGSRCCRRVASKQPDPQVLVPQTGIPT